MRRPSLRARGRLRALACVCVLAIAAAWSLHERAVIALVRKHPKRTFVRQAEPAEWALSAMPGSPPDWDCATGLGGMEDAADDRVGVCTGRGDDVVLTVLTHTGAAGKRLRNALRANRVGYARSVGARYCEFFAPIDWGRHPAWSKVLATLAVLPSVGGHLLLIDADAILARPTPLSHLMRTGGPGDGKAVLFTTDYGPDSPLNTGLVVLSGASRHGAALRSLWTRVYNDFPAAVDSIFWEQAALVALSRADPVRFVTLAAVVSHESLNQHRTQFGPGRPDFGAAAFGVHYGGLPHKWERLHNESLTWAAAGACHATAAEMRAHCAGADAVTYAWAPLAPVRRWRWLSQESVIRRAMYLASSGLQSVLSTTRLTWRTSAVEVRPGGGGVVLHLPWP